MRKSIDLVRVYTYMKADTWEQTRRKTFTDSSGSELGQAPASGFNRCDSTVIPRLTSDPANEFFG